MIVRLSHAAGDALWTLAGILNQYPRLTMAGVITLAAIAGALAIYAFLSLTRLILEDLPPRPLPPSPKVLEAIARADRPDALPRELAFPAERVVRLHIPVRNKGAQL